MDAATYALCKKYVNNSLIGIGALKGAPCEVDTVVKTGGITTVTLKWEDTAGGIHNESFDILDGTSVTSATINSSGNLIITLSNGISIDCGKATSQYSVMPDANASNLGVIIQYVGSTTHDYVKGYFYECVLSGSGYEWEQKNVQPVSGGSSDYDTLTNKPGINNVELSGNKTTTDLDLVDGETIYVNGDEKIGIGIISNTQINDLFN